MLTRCPRCETTFRVTPEQLKARLGRVRCGHCQNVFNALDTLIEAVPPPVPAEAPQEPFEEALPAAAAEIEEVAVPSEAAELPSEAGPAAPVATAANDEVVSAPEAEPVEASPSDRVEEDVEPEPIEVGTESEPIDALAGPEPIEALHEPGSPEPAPEAEPELPQETVPADEPRDAGTAALESELHDEPATKRAWPWAVAAATALVALAMQVALHFRTEISVLYPDARPLLTAACAPFGCDVALPRKPELIGIETSNLSPEASGKLTLTATLKNRAPFPQQYPNLELTLTDTADQPLVRRVLAPAHYLPHTADVAAGFGAGAGLSINLVVDAPGVPAAGYQLYLFYP